MSKVRFSAAAGIGSYAGRIDGRVHDGDVIEVSDEIASYLCDSFPKNFARVKADPVPGTAKAALDGPDHKAVVEPPRRRRAKPKKGAK